MTVVPTAGDIKLDDLIVTLCVTATNRLHASDASLLILPDSL